MIVLVKACLALDMLAGILRMLKQCAIVIALRTPTSYRESVLRSQLFVTVSDIHWGGHRGDQTAEVWNWAPVITPASCGFEEDIIKQQEYWLSETCAKSLTFRECQEIKAFVFRSSDCKRLLKTYYLLKTDSPLKYYLIKNNQPVR